MICRKTMEECKTPSMCAPFQGCTPESQQAGSMMLHKSDVEFLAARVRRLCHAFDYPVPSDDDHFVIGVAGSLIGAILTNMELARRRAPSDIDTARLEGWHAAREMAAKVCDEHAVMATNGEGSEWSASCATAIRAMQPPAEWGE